MTNTTPSALPQTIADMIAQLGGNGIFRMAFKSCVYDAAGNDAHAAELRLQIARDLVQYAPGKATHVVVTLDWADVYSVKLLKVGKINRRTYEIPEPVTVAQIGPVYADTLKSAVETMTGFRLSL